MADTTPIYTLYFDEKGHGPTALELQLRVFETPREIQELRARRLVESPREEAAAIALEHAPIGIEFKRAGGFNLNDAPVGGGFFFNDRASLVELHRQLGELITVTSGPQEAK